MSTIKLGDKVKDCITGFEGIAIAKAEYLNGCISIQVQSAKLNKDGSVPKAEWFDEQQLDTKSKTQAGGPQDYPIREYP